MEQLVLDLSTSTAYDIASMLESWLVEVCGADERGVRMFRELSESVGITEAFERSKTLRMVYMRGMPFDTYAECVNPYLEHHHVCWDRSWAHSNGWMPRMLPFIEGWDYGRKRPVFRKTLPEM